MSNGCDSQALVNQIGVRQEVTPRSPAPLSTWRVPQKLWNSCVHPSSAVAVHHPIYSFKLLLIEIYLNLLGCNLWFSRNGWGADLAAEPWFCCHLFQYKLKSREAEQCGSGPGTARTSSTWLLNMCVSKGSKVNSANILPTMQTISYHRAETHRWGCPSAAFFIHF